MALHLLDKQYQEHINNRGFQENQTGCWIISIEKVRQAIDNNEKVYLYSKSTLSPFMGGQMQKVTTCNDEPNRVIITFDPDDDLDTNWPGGRSYGSPFAWS